MFSLGSLCYSEDSFDQFTELIFYAVFVYLTFGLSNLWWTPAVKGFVQAQHNFLWSIHGPSMTLSLLLCHSLPWLRYLGGVVLMLTVWTLGEDCIDEFGKWDYSTLKLLIGLNLHHHGGVIALYSQQPEDALLNALFFGHFWWAHSLGTFQIETRIKNAWKKFTGYECTQFMNGYACLTVFWCAVYCHFMPIGFNYHGLAIASMVVGRWSVMDNYLNIGWMGKIEIPGVLFFVTCKAIGEKTALVVLVAWVFFYQWAKKQAGENMAKPPKFVMSKKIQNFLESYPLPEQDEGKIKQGLAWFDGQFERGTLPVFRAIVEFDDVKLKDLLDNGADPNQVEEKWQSTPFHWAASSGSINCAFALLEAGVNPFAKGVRKNARLTGQKAFLKFLDELTPLAWDALREETNMRHERQPEPGMTWAMANDFAKAKGGRLCTVKEVQQYMMGAPLLVDQVQWCACTDEDGSQKWIQVGNKFYPTGKIMDHQSDPNFWGNNLENKINTDFKWLQYVIWFVDSVETETSSRGVESGA